MWAEDVGEGLYRFRGGQLAELQVDGDGRRRLLFVDESGTPMRYGNVEGYVECADGWRVLEAGRYALGLRFDFDFDELTRVDEGEAEIDRRFRAIMQDMQWED